MYDPLNAYLAQIISIVEFYSAALYFLSREAVLGSDALYLKNNLPPTQTHESRFIEW